MPIIIPKRGRYAIANFDLNEGFDDGPKGEEFPPDPRRIRGDFDLLEALILE